MADETEISAPDETAATEDTSIDEPAAEDNTADTSNIEPSAPDDTADNGNTQQNTIAQEPEKLYAGKYKSIEEFEKGHNALNAELTRLQQWKSEQVKQLETQKALRLEQARQQGFSSAEAQEIARRAAIEEFNAYFRAAKMLAPEYAQAAEQNLLNYCNTGNTQYLDEAKRYFPSDFIENIALNKQNLINQLNSEYMQAAQKTFNEREMQLAETIKTDYADFISDLKDNAPKAKALEMFCKAGFIQSKEDFQIFTDIFSQIENNAKAKAVKEYEAQKAVKEAKEKAVIASAPAAFDLDKKYTSKDIGKMPQKVFDEYCAKYGTDWIYNT